MTLVTNRCVKSASRSPGAPLVGVNEPRAEQPPGAPHPRGTGRAGRGLGGDWGAQLPGVLGTRAATSAICHCHSGGALHSLKSPPSFTPGGERGRLQQRRLARPPSLGAGLTLALGGTHAWWQQVVPLALLRPRPRARPPSPSLPPAGSGSTPRLPGSTGHGSAIPAGSAEPEGKPRPQAPGRQGAGELEGPSGERKLTP